MNTFSKRRHNAALASFLTDISCRHVFIMPLTSEENGDEYFTLMTHRWQELSDTFPTQRFYVDQYGAAQEVLAHIIEELMRRYGVAIHIVPDQWALSSLGKALWPEKPRWMPSLEEMAKTREATEQAA